MTLRFSGSTGTKTATTATTRTGNNGTPSQTIRGRYLAGSGPRDDLSPQRARQVLNLWVTDDVFFKSLRLSSTTNNIAGTIQWDGSDFLGYDGNQWKSLTSGVGGIDTKTVSATYDNSTYKVTFNRDDGATFLLDLSQLVNSSGISLNNLSVLPKPPASGDGHLGYDNTTGEFTYTPPDLSGYLTSESDPIFSAHTSFNIPDGTGFLKNDGSGTWSYDNNTYLTNSDIYTDSDVDAHLNQTNPTSGYVLSWDGSDYVWVAQSSGGINLTNLSVLPEPAPAGDGHLGYDNTTGEFTFTPPDLSGFAASSSISWVVSGLSLIHI